MKNSTRFYRHYKDKPYKFLGYARHSETLEELALYETLYQNDLGKVWVRPKDMFFENVEINGVVRPRFEKINFEFRIEGTVDEKEIASVYFAAFGKPLDIEKFRAKLKTHSRVHCQIAFDGKTMIGFKIGYAQDDISFCSWLGAVRPDFQGLGVASELMSLQHAWCRQNGFKKIETRTHNEFTEMIRLNLKYGFLINGTQSYANESVKVIFEKKLI